MICKKIIVFLLFINCCFENSNAQLLPAPYRLRCDLLLHTDVTTIAGIDTKLKIAEIKHPVGKFDHAKIITTHPVFYWETDTACKKQSACRILVASTKKLLETNKADLWDSKKIIQSQSQLTYNGKQLEAGKIYFWKLQYWNENDQSSSFSKTSSFKSSQSDTSELFSHHSLHADLQLAEKIMRKEDGTYFLDFGKAAFAQLQFTLTSLVTDSIWIEAAEALESPQTILRNGGNIRYIKQGLWVKKGTHQYSLTWPTNAKRNTRNPILMPDAIGEVFPFRYLSIINFKGTIERNNVTRKMIYYPFDDKASHFYSSDTILNQVWDLCKYSIKATSFSGYYVDGDRERLPYEADALINQLSHYAVDAEFSMARRSMAFLLFHPTWPTEWSLQNVLLAWNDYLYTGNDAFLKMYYTELQKKILIPLAAKNGLISTTAKKQEDDFLESIHMMKDFDGKHGLKDNVDWPQKGNFIGNEKEYGGETDGFVYTHYNSVVNAFYYRTLLLMQKIAFVLNKDADANSYRLRANELYQSFQQVFRNEKTGLIKDGDTTLHSSLHANMFALCFGLVQEQDRAKVISFIKTRKMACSVYGAQFLLDALYDAGEDEYALSLMTATTQRSWYNMIRFGSTITMEAWDKLYKPNLDLNHAWGAAPANIIVRKLMGVEPVSPGGDTIQIQPRPGNLGFATLTTTTLKGKVTVHFERTALKDSYEMTIPGSVSANIILPFASSKSVVLMDGKKQAVKPLNGFVVFDHVKAGKHHWQIQ